MPPTTLAPTPSYSLEAEASTIAALLLDGDKMMDIAPLLSADDFYERTYAAIYRAIKTLHDDRRPIDIVTVYETIRSQPKTHPPVESAFLAELTQSVATAANVSHYAEIVREKSLRRRLATVGSSITALAATDGKSAGELMETAERQLLQLSRQSAQAKPIDLVEIAPERYEYYALLHEAEDTTEHLGIRTGFTKLDDLLLGLSPGHLMILAGRPSMGKTALALNITRHVAEQQQKAVTFFSLEMTKEDVADRILGSMLGVDASKLKRGLLTDAQFGQMGSVFDGLTERRIFIDDDPNATLANIRSKARRHQFEHGLDLLIVDYLQLIEVTDRAAGENQTQRITFISKSLKSLARELHCPVIALSQLSRACEQRTPAIPVLSDLRDSGAIEQDADSVLMLYREGYYNNMCDNPDATDVYVRKNRQGTVGHLELQFAKERMEFR